MTHALRMMSCTLLVGVQLGSVSKKNGVSKVQIVSSGVLLTV